MVESSSLGYFVKIEESVELLDVHELELVEESKSEASVSVSDDGVYSAALVLLGSLSADEIQVV